MVPARELIWAAYRAAVARCEPGAAVRSALGLEGPWLRAGERRVDLLAVGQVRLLGAGKAAGPMALAVEEILGERLAGGVAVTKDGHEVELRRVELLLAAHPVPDGRSEAAGRRLLDEAARLGPGDLAIAVLSGGASALAEVPAPGLTLDGLRRAHEALLRSGLPIEQMNAERTRLSALKGGKLAAACGGAAVLTLVLSDVPTGGPEVVGSGPTIRGFSPDDPRELVVLVGDHRVALGEARAALVAGCGAVEARPGWLSGGSARGLGGELGGLWRGLRGGERRAWVASGEATARVRGGGRGGRNQELALAAALALEGTVGVTVGALATDGQDGPTDAAGAIVDGATASRARELGFSPEFSLENSDAYPLLDAVGALVRTGPTRTNVNDLVVMVVEPWASGRG